MSNDYKLTLGACLFNWKVNDWQDFYFKIADETPIDEVYLGEVVCYKRYPFFEVAFENVVDRLTKAGKKVHFSTFSLILSDLEMNTCKKLIEKAQDNTLIEVNDVGLLGLLKDKPYIIGPTVNVYNEGTIKTLEEQGAKRFCFPYEIDKESLRVMASTAKPTTEKEIFAFGRMPLAIAARCYHARIHHTSKDDCKYVCEKDYNGKVISTLVDENFLTVNGTQTMSYSYNNLINEVHDLMAMGINIFRISPHYMDMNKIIALFKDVLDKKITGTEALATMQPLLPKGEKFSNGFYYGGEGRLYEKFE
ncbi:MAG: U32 family peptidase [Alphaproteobacteria bacterium]|jgi:collagenase-like PrtC family protease|nr:U32 family peptidase [Alphaproteobacteria bacterium]